MKNNNWSKTILEVYRYLPRVTYAYDKIIKSKAINSQYTRTYDSFNNVFDVTNSIIDLSQRKITLINLKIITEKILKTIDKKYAKLLVLRFVDGYKFSELANIFKVSQRTLFRRITKALDSFTHNLVLQGFDSKKLFDELKEENWIMEVYKSYNCQIEFNICEYADITQQIKTNIMMEFKKASGF